MKKIILSVALIVFLVFTGFGQTTFKPAIGVSFNDFSETSTGDVKGKAGFQIGGSVSFGKKFYIEPGVFYATKSSEFAYSSTTSSSTAEDAVIKGIRVPVAVGVGVIGNEESLVSLRAFGGGSGFFVTGVGDNLHKGNISSPSWGVFAGAGADFWIMFAEVSYEWSVTDATKNESEMEIGKSRTLFFTVGLRF